jgi:mono/diheme cytochrome c family protein
MRANIVLRLAVLAGSVLGPTLASAADAAAPQAAHWAVLEKYCFGCHNTEDWAGGMAFDTLNAGNLPADARTWEAVIRKLRGRLMPPPGKDQPETPQVKGVVTWLETSLDAAAVKEVTPGRVGLHRLNRREYANAVRDLLDLSIDPAALLPRDDAADGFDNIASALQVSPSFLDQYLSAAQTVATLALGNPASLPAATNYAVRDAGTQRRHRDGLPFGTRGGIVVEHFFPADGEYALTVANMAGALWVLDLEHVNTLVALLDGKEFFRTTIGGEGDIKAIDQLQDPAVDAINKRLKNVRFQAKEGVRKVAVTFLERTLAESDSRLHTIAPDGGQDRIQRLVSFEVRGPFSVTGVSQSPSRARVLVCQPAKGASAGLERDCAARIVQNLAHQAFRRPLNDGDTNGLMRLYDAARKDADFEAGVKRALTGVLASPHFLFRSDLSRDALMTASAGGVHKLSDLALASRLAFFLWSSLPDAQLLSIAERGELQGDVLAAQVKRMLADERAESLVTNFAFQWLNIGKLAEIDADPRIFPYAAGLSDPRPDFREELRLFIDSVLHEDHSILDLLSADYTFVNERLAVHYGIADIKGDRFQRVNLAQPTRYGLLGKGAILMLTSYPNRTAPVLRGQWVLDRMLGTPPAPPPPMVESLKENTDATPKTVRERMELHRRNPSCNACHGIMDPLGFALENFDAVGQYRTLDRDARQAIDASGILPDGTKVGGPEDLRKALLARSDQFAQTFTEKLLTYALGRSVEYHDMPSVRAISRKSALDQYRFSSIVMGIVLSDAFQQAQAAPTPRVLTTQTEVH